MYVYIYMYVCVIYLSDKKQPKNKTWGHLLRNKGPVALYMDFDELIGVHLHPATGHQQIQHHLDASQHPGRPWSGIAWALVTPSKASSTDKHS